MPVNRAAFIQGAKARPLVVKAAPYTPPGPGQIVVKNAAVAINPLDDAKQTLGNIMFGWIKYPFIMGSDIAGRVVEVGPDVTRFKVGDRVMGLAFGMDQKYNTSTMGGFQHYTVMLARMTSPIPDSLEFANAAVLPLALSTAASALFQKDQLGLRHPPPADAAGQQTGAAAAKREVLLVWGGSSAVGCNAIQLAVAAGYDVVTTCSPKNFALVQRLGAAAAFDYRSPTVVDDLAGFCRDRRVAGALAMGDGDGSLACVDVLGRCQGNRFVSIVSFPAPKNKDAGLPTALWTMAWWQAAMTLKCTTKGVGRKFVWGSTLEGNEVGPLIWEAYLPRALARGAYAAAPEPHIVGHGLERVQEGIDMVHKGVSAKKCVITLE